MKNIILSCFVVLISSTAFAKKVKFAVDMSAQTVSPNGVFVSGDFQAIAGFPGGDWVSNSTPLTQEGSTSIYSTIVDLPAFAKYEYKFLNGDQFYDAEFVPIESRVGYDFDDSRWVYVDSLGNDTTFVGAILFAENAPAGKKLVRFLVDMQSETAATAGIHLGGDFQGWDVPATILYNFTGSIYEVIQYVDAGTIAWKYYNGSTTGETETVPGTCAVNGNRELAVTDHVVLDVVCFSSCSACVAGMDDIASFDMELYPNPTTEMAVLKTSVTDFSVIVTDMNGNVVRTIENNSTNQLTLEKGQLNTGLYFVRLVKDNTVSAPLKWIIQ